MTVPRRRGVWWLLDAEGGERTAFAVGDSLFVSGLGLQPCTLYEFALERGRKRTLLARYVSDRHGSLPASLLIPYLGCLGDGIEPGRALQIRASGGRRSDRLPFVVEQDRKRPRIFASDGKAASAPASSTGPRSSRPSSASHPPASASTLFGASSDGESAT